MNIRPAKASDVDAIGELWLQLVNFHRALDEDMPQAAEDGIHRYASRIRYSLNDTLVKTLVAEADGLIVGYVMGMVIDLMPETFVEERAGMVADIYVLEAYRGQGVGLALMQSMKEWFVLRGVSHYEWYVASMNQQGRQFWEKTMGGKPIMIRMRASTKTEE